MATRKLIPNNPSDAYLVKGYYEKDPDISISLKKKLNDFFEKEYKGIYSKKKVIEELFQKEAEALLKRIEAGQIYVNDDGSLIETDGRPLKEDGLFLFISKKIDAFLVKGYYDNTPGIGDTLGERLTYYYYNNYYGLFQVNSEDADEIFQMTANALLINIRIRRIYVNNNGDLIGVNNKPFSSALTTYFMAIAKNMHHELVRIRKRGGSTDEDPDGLPDIAKVVQSGLSAPYEKYEENKGGRSGRWFWYYEGESTGIEVKSVNPNSKTTKKMPYIGDDMHWWIGNDDNAKDIGALYNDMLYNDKQITLLTKIARLLSQMTCMCKDILTLSLYFEKSNEEIVDIKGYKNSDVVKSKKHDCLKRLQSLVKGVAL